MRLFHVGPTVLFPACAGAVLGDAIMADAAVSTTRERVARTVSNVASPPVLMAAAAVQAGLWSATEAEIKLFLLGLGVMMLTDLALWWTKQISSPEADSIEERILVLWCVTPTAILTTGVFWICSDSRDLVVFECGIAATLAALTAITTKKRWKISVHAAGCGTLAGEFLIHWQGWMVAATLVLAAAVAWSRLVLGKHDHEQVLAGTAIVPVIFVAVYFIFR